MGLSEPTDCIKSDRTDRVDVYVEVGALRVGIPDHEDTGCARLHVRIHGNGRIGFIAQSQVQLHGQIRRQFRGKSTLDGVPDDAVSVRKGDFEVIVVVAVVAVEARERGNDAIFDADVIECELFGPVWEIGRGLGFGGVVVGAICEHQDVRVECCLHDAVLDEGGGERAEVRKGFITVFPAIAPWAPCFLFSWLWCGSLLCHSIRTVDSFAPTSGQTRGVGQ